MRSSPLRTAKRARIVEDDAGARRLLSALPGELGFETAEACDGLDAIQRLRNGRFDPLLVDLIVPKIDGYFVVRCLEEKLPNAHAIVISSVRRQELDDPAGSFVVQAVLPKPPEVNTLKARRRESLA